MQNLHRHLRVRSATVIRPSDPSTARAILDVFPVGVIVVDAHACVLHANNAGERVLRARDGLQRDGVYLNASSPEWSRRVRALVDWGVSTREASCKRETRVLLVPRPSGGQPIQLRAAPVRRNEANPDAGQREVALFVSAHESKLELPEDQVQRLFHLTPAEARVAIQVALGATPREIADRAGVQMNTIRCQLKQIYSKTGARRQADLVRLLLTGPLTLDLGA